MSKIHIEALDRAKKAAKRLKLNVDDWIEDLGIKPLPLSWYQETTARMLGHDDWQDLRRDIESYGGPASELDETVSDAELRARRHFQASVLIERVREAIGDRLPPDVLQRIAKHVGVSGHGSAGLAFRKETVALTDEGVLLPVDMDRYTEHAVFGWDPDQFRDPGRFRRLVELPDPKVRAILARLSEEWSTAERFTAAHEILRIDPISLDGKRLLALSIAHLDLGGAETILRMAYLTGSVAWAPEAERRRRHKNRIKWWVEPETRPFMMVVGALADVLAEFDDPENDREALHLARALYQLEKSDPLDMTTFIEERLGIPILDRAPTSEK